MFELKVTENERDGYLYKNMHIDLGNKKEEVYIKIPISEKPYITNLYDPYVVFNIYKMMSIGGECYIRGEVSKSLLDNLEMFVNCWTIWLPEKCKNIKIIADREIDDPPKSFNNDAVLSFSGGLDSVSTLYRHHKGLAGRNNKNIKKLLAITGARDISSRRGAYDISYQEIYHNKTKKMNSIAKDLGFDTVPIETNLYETDTIFDWIEEFVVLFISIMMLYQDTYNNLLIASDQFVNPDSLSLRHRASNPITNKLIQSNRFKLITDGEFLTRFDKMDSIKDWQFALENLLACDRCFTEKNKCCGECGKCLSTKLNYKLTNANVDFNKIYENPDFNLSDYKIGGDNHIFYEEALFYNDKKNVLDKETIDILKKLIEKNKYPELYNLKQKLKEKEEQYNNLVNKIAWWIPIRKFRDNFKKKFI